MTTPIDPEAADPDLLDEPVLPALGLSVSALAAIFVGGAVGTLLRYLLEVHHPIGQGGFPWPTLTVNLSGSLVIGLILPLTEHVVAPTAARSTTLRRRPPRRLDHVLHPGRRGHAVGQGRACRDVSRLPGRNGRRWGRPGDRRTRGREEAGPVVSPSPSLGLVLLVAAAGGVGAVLRALLIHHVGLRTTGPASRWARWSSNASGSLLLGILTGLSLYHGVGSHLLAVAGTGLCGGYTTWSTASWETVHLLHTGHRSEAVVYTFGGLIVCLGARGRGHRSDCPVLTSSSALGVSSRKPRVEDTNRRGSGHRTPG